MVLDFVEKPTKESRCRKDEEIDIDTEPFPKKIPMLNSLNTNEKRFSISVLSIETLKINGFSLQELLESDIAFRNFSRQT